MAMSRTPKVDKWFLGIVIALIVTGFFIFMSASLGLLAREGARFSAVVFKQIVFGLGVGSVLLYGASRIKYTFWRKYSFYIFGASVILTAAVFVPHVGFSHGGATRWLNLGPLSFQPAEFLKLGFVIYFAAWLGAAKQKVELLSYGLIPFVGLIGFVAAIMLAQPDTATFLIAASAGTAMFIVSGAQWKHLGAVVLLGIVGVTMLFFVRPYFRDRFMTYFDPSRDPQGSGYQVQQSLIAIGSGRVTGRGFGQSIQKFNYLPEPIGDSIFAVAAEEFGFVGSVFIVGLFVAFSLRGLRIAARAPDLFSGLAVIGIVILVVGQAFLNIGSMLGLFPLGGLPLPFVSQGATALLFTCLEVGIILNISRYRKT